MKLTPLRPEVVGEQLVAIVPAPAADRRALVWHRRLNLYTGRSLSADALTNAQQERAGHLALAGQYVSAGVVSGLEIALEQDESSEGDTLFALHLAAGYGIAASGEDVAVPVNRAIPVMELPVYAPIDILRPPQDGSPPSPTPGGLAQREMGPTLGELVDPAAGTPVAIPPAGILVLQPVWVEIAGESGEEGQCEDDPQNDAFADFQIADACQVVYYAWPTEWLALPSAATADEWRNTLAHAIFQRESLNRPGEIMPWEDLGVPVGLLAFDNDWNPVLVDRHSVVRAGGKPLRRSVLIPNAGNVFLWQARMEQLAEQLAAPSSPEDAAAHLRYLPPAGILPRSALTLGQSPLTSAFFPASYHLEAVPIPIDQLDVAFEASAALQPYDTQVADDVRLLVPVPAQWYEPELLQDEQVDPAFAETLERFSARRNELLARRDDVQSKASALLKALRGSANGPVYPDDTSGSEKPSEDPLVPPEQDYGTEEANGERRAALIESLSAQLVEDLKTAATDGAALRAQIHEQITGQGLEAYIQALTALVNKANDTIDYGFLRVQTDTYRMRRILLGTDKANRLATSTALASIVQDEQSVYATREQLLQYLDKLPRERVNFSVQPLHSVSGIEGQPDAGAEPAAGVRAEGIARPELFIREDLTNPTLARPPIFTPVEMATAAAAGEFEVILQPTHEDVVEQLGTVGIPMELRTTTIAERFTVSAAEEAKSTTAASNFEVVSGLGQIGGLFDDLAVPYVKGYGENNAIVRDTKKIGDLKATDYRDLLTPKELPGADEVNYFAVGVDNIDQVVASLRLAEGQVQRYRKAIDSARKALDQLRDLVGQVDRRLKEIGDALAEARHDVAVGGALLAEEQARIGAINQRRHRILDEYVTFIAYQRPRHVDLLLDTPMRNIDPGVGRSSLPACLGTERSVPYELRALVDLLRGVPLRWLVELPPLLQRLDRIDLLRETLTTAQRRAQLPVQDRSALLASASLQGALGQAIAGTFAVQQQAVSAHRAQVAVADFGLVTSQTWAQTRDLTANLATLADLVEAGHGRSDVSQGALRELDDVANVAACLYEAFGGVTPALRLRWAEMLSQYDAPVSLRSLLNLPGWDQVEVLDRRAMQEMVDWLFGRVDPDIPQAVALINDLIRVCILLASHAPVNQIIAGRVTRKTSVLPGTRLTLAADLSKVQVGMQVLVFDKQDSARVIAQAVVEDLAPGNVAARVVEVAAGQVEVDEQTFVHFTRSFR